MSLEDKAVEFAQNIRLYLLAEVAAKNKDLKTGEIKGFDENGKAIVEVEGKDVIVDPTGSAYQTEGTKVFVDKTNSIEYKKAEKKEPVVLPERKKVEVTPVKKLPRSLTVPALFLEEEEDIFELPEYSFMVNVFTKRIPLNAYGGVGGTFQQFTNSVTETAFSLGSPSYPATNSTDGILLTAAICGASASGRSTYATIDSDLISLSAAAETPDASTQDYELVESDPLVEIQSGSDRKYTVFSYTYRAYSDYLNINWGRARGSAGYKTLPDAKYFYVGGGGTREVNINDYVNGSVIDHEIWHNYVCVENQEVIAYTIFYVRSISSSGDPIAVPNDPFPTEEWRYGEINHYWLHIKLNITTNSREYKTSQITSKHNGSTWSDVQDIYTGRFYIFNPLNGSSGLTSAFYDNRDEYRRRAERYSFYTAPDDPDTSGLFSNAFDGDWISSWNIGNPGSVSISTIKSFLTCSYKNGKYYKNADTLMPIYWDSSTGVEPYIYEYEPLETSAFYNGAGGNTSQMSSFISEVMSGTSYLYSDFFDGTRGGGSADISNWTRYVQAYEYVASNSDVVDGRFGPNSSVSLSQDTSSISDGINHGERMHREIQTSYVPLPSS